MEEIAGGFRHPLGDQIFIQSPMNLLPPFQEFDVVLEGRALLESTNNNNSTAAEHDAELLERYLGFTKKCAIIKSCTGSVSCLASVLIVWMILRSHVRLSSPFHRLLFGLSIADILSSFFNALSTVMSPSDVSYYVWNARGNVTTCSIQGFFFAAGFFCCALYTCSLCLYYLAVVRYGKTNEYIRQKFELYLHVVPISVALIAGITMYALDGFNATLNGHCALTPHLPLHCKNYEFGVVPEGYTIPCGRGIRTVPIASIAFVWPLFITTPVAIVVIMGMIYRTVLEEERRMEMFGRGTLRTRSNSARTTLHDGNFSGSESGVGMRMRSTFSSNNNAEPTRRVYLQSRIILYRGIAYSTGFLMSWLFIMVGISLVYARVKIPEWVSLCYFVLVPLQGFYNFIIFMYPRVLREKRRNTTRRQKISWCGAFSLAFWSKGKRRGLGSSSNQQGGTAENPN